MNSPADQITENDRADSPGGLKRLLRKLRLIRNGEGSLRESLEEVIEEHEVGDGEDALAAEERSMLRNVLRYGDLRIEDIMVPRADIVSVELGIPFPELVARFAKASHSRIPVYRTTLDEIIGMVHVKDALRVLATGDDESVDTESLLRPVLFVSPAMKLMDLLARMRVHRTHMAIVVDEYGGTDGLVTIEDLVEQIVGDIEDEHDERSAPKIIKHGEGLFEADARLLLEDLESEIHCDLLPDERDEDIDTVGGLVVSLAGRVPAIGECVPHQAGYRFEILDADERRVKRVRVLPPVSEIDDGE